MFSALIAQVQIDIGERQGGRHSKFITPAQSARSDHDFPLGKQPIGRHTGFCLGHIGLRDIQPRYGDAALRIAANHELGLINHQLFKAQIKQGLWRDGSRHGF